MQERSQTYESFDAVRPLKIWPGVLAHEIRGNDVAFALVELEPDTFTFTIGGETRELRPGDTYSIPGGVPHSARSGPEGAPAVDRQQALAQRVKKGVARLRHLGKVEGR